MKLSMRERPWSLVLRIQRDYELGYLSVCLEDLSVVDETVHIPWSL